MDFGNIQIPTKWNEVTLEQFQKLLKIYKQEDRDILDIVSVFSGLDKKELKIMPKEFIDEMIIHLQFMNTPLRVEPSDKLEINGNTYRINYMEKLKFGEFVDCETILKSDEFDYASLLGILARLDGEVYDDDFIANKLDKRIEMFKLMPISKALVLINFFLQLRMRYIAHSQRSLALKQGKEAAESLVQSIKDSVKGGAGNMLNSLYVKRKLKRLEKSLKCI